MFDKNLEYLSNEDLKTRLKAISIEASRLDISYCMTTSNDYLLMKNDVPLDDMNNPRQAVQDMLKANIKKEGAKPKGAKRGDQLYEVKG